jgi:hypothetical protein
MPQPSQHCHRSCSVAGLSALIAALVVVLCSGVAVAATYNVATTGNDSNNGSASSPWRTLGKAARMVAPGDTVLVAPGTYKERLKMAASGTASAPITFRNSSATQAAIIDGSGTTGTDTTLLKFQDTSYIRVTGLTVKNGTGWCVAVTGNSHHIELSQMDVSNCSSSGIWIYPSNSTPNYTVVRQSKIHENGAGGITVWASPGGYFLIEDNEAYKNLGGGNYDGIQVGGGDGATHHVVVRRNIAWGNGEGTNGADQIDLGGHGIGDHYLAEENIVWGPGGVMKVHQGERGGAQGIIARRNRLSGRGFAVYGYPNPVVYYNNTIVDGSIQLWSDRADSPPGRNFGGMEFKNNLVLQSGDYLVYVAGAPGYLIDVRPSSVLFANNLYKFTGKGMALYAPQIFNANLADPQGASEFAAYQAARSPNFQDVGSRRTTAALTSILVDAANRDYHLKEGSPAIDAGGPLTKATNNGSNAKVVAVVRADYFQDGYSGLIQGDLVKVGGNPPVLVTSVDEVGKKITLADPISWNAGDPVTLPYEGNAPDAGAYEFQSGPSAPSAPSLLSVEPIN